MPEISDAVRQLARFQERYAAKRDILEVVKGYEIHKDLLIYEEGHRIEAEDCGDAWYRLNSFMFSAGQLKEYRLGNRHMVPRISICIKHWTKLIPLETFGYKHFRIGRLKRNYLNEESLLKCRQYMDKRKLDSPSTHGIIFGTGRKLTPPCLVSGNFFYRPGILLADFTLRASEVTKTLGADLHFLSYVLDNAVPPEMRQCLGSVTLHLGMAYCLAQWFPLLDMIMPGYPINTQHRFHRMCMDSIRKVHDSTVESKWKPERRMQRRYRAMYKAGKYRKNLEGRIVAGPSYFPLKEKHLS